MIYMGPTLQKENDCVVPLCFESRSGFLFLARLETHWWNELLVSTVLDRKQNYISVPNHSYMAKTFLRPCLLRRPLQPLQQDGQKPCITIFRCKNWLKKALLCKGSFKPVC